MHRKQVDQSGRLEDARTTVWAYADGESRTLSMSASVKRKAFAVLKDRQITGVRALVRVYTAALVLLLKEAIAIPGTVVELDREYPGYDADIKGMLLRKLRQAGSRVSAKAIVFANIGKKALAHDLAWKVYVGLRLPDVKASWAEVERLL